MTRSLMGLTRGFKPLKIPLDAVKIEQFDATGETESPVSQTGIVTPPDAE